MQDLGVDFEFRDTNKDPLSKTEFSKLMGKRPISEFLNARSRPFKERGLEGKKINKTEAIALMQEDVNFLKRPILVMSGEYVFGYDEDAYRELAG